MTLADYLATYEGKWCPASPTPREVVSAMARDSALMLPSDYLEFLALSNGGDGFLAVGPGYLQLWSAEEVLSYNSDYQIPEVVPGFFGFGGNGGGEFFAFDTRGSQPWPIVSIPFFPMEVALATIVACSFTELLDHVCFGENQDA